MEIGIVTFHFGTQGGFVTEVNEMKRDLHSYCRDQWNVLDFFTLLFLTAGWSFRWVDSEGPWGRAFYALGAPFLFSRVLFFAQYLPFQGPIIQVSLGIVLSCCTSRLSLQ